VLTYQTILNLRKLALKSRLNPDIDDYVEKCYRHYSKTYATPLDQAKSNLTVPEVMLVYMQDELENLEKDELELFKEKLYPNSGPILSMPVAEKNEDELALEDNAWVAQQEALLRDKEEKDKKNQDDIVKKTHEAIESLTKNLNATMKKNS